MNSETYITPFWIQDVSGSSWSLRLYSRNSGSTHGDLDWTIDVEYSTDGSTWRDFGTTQTSRNRYINLSFSANQKVYLRSKTQCTHWGKYDTSNNRFWYIQIYSNNQYSVGGNIMSLIYGSTFADNLPNTNSKMYTVFPDDTLKGIFFGLFYSGGSTNNTNLIDASELVLPVTHSTSTVPSSSGSAASPLNRCYAYMFLRCTSLVGGPHIDLRARAANDLAYCFQQMFNYSTSLLNVHCNTQAGNYRFNTMFSNGGGASGSVFYDYSGGPASSEVPTARMEYRHIVSMYLSGAHEYDRVVDWHSNYSGYVNQVDDDNNITIYKKNVDPEANGYFWIYNKTNENKYVTISKEEDGPNIQVYKKRVNEDWSYAIDTTYVTSRSILIPPHEKVYFKATTTHWGTSYPQSYVHFSESTDSPIFEIGGNIMSLLYGDDYMSGTSFLSSYAFASIFEGWKSLEYADKLNMPVKNFGAVTYVYSAMFYDCNNLKTAPSLPATTLTGYCYREMFARCRSLVTAPSLPATTLKTACYEGMFAGCTSLTSAPTISATTVADHSCFEMFSGCTSLVTAPVLSATTMVDYCYYSMFENCTSLVTPPALPANTLAEGCYYAMFRGCTSLTSTPTLSATTLVKQCYAEMFKGCTSLTTVTTLPATTMISRCYSSMFQGCTSLTTAPELPATRMEEYCYEYMFSGCTHLNYIKCLATSNQTLVYSYENTNHWIENVAATGTFAIPSAGEGIWNTMGGSSSGKPTGWTTVYV